MFDPRSAPQTGTPGATLLAAGALAGASHRARLADVGGEFARPPGWRMGDEVRARALLIAEASLRHAEGALRAADPLLDAAPAVDLLERFARTGLLARSGLAAAAWARAEEHRLVHAIAAVVDMEGEGPAVRLLDPIGGGLAAESYAVRLAEAARLDRAGDPLLPMHDLPPEDRHALFWQVAAALAQATLATQGEAAAGNADRIHRAAAAAVARTLAIFDDGDGIAAAAMRHARAVADAGENDDALAAGTFAAGRIASFAALLAVRAGIGFADARDMLGAPARAAILLRACDVAPPAAAAIMVALAFALDGDGETLELIVADFETLPVARARAEVRRARLDPVYRDALEALA